MILSLPHLFKAILGVRYNKLGENIVFFTTGHAIDTVQKANGFENAFPIIAEDNVTVANIENIRTGKGSFNFSFLIL